MEIARAQPLDFLEVVDLSGNPLIRTRRRFGLYARQVTSSEAVTFRDAAGGLVAIVGLYRREDGDHEGWLAAGPSLKAHLRPLVQDLRADAERLIAAFDLNLVTFIDPRSVAGPRLAAILGFHPCGLTESPIGPLRTYRRSRACRPSTISS